MNDTTPRRDMAVQRPHWSHAAWWFATGVFVGGVIALTILPGSPAPFQWAATKLGRWVDAADLAAALNVLLFMPIGAMIAIISRARWLWLAPIMSMAVELTQFIIPQRNPSLLDVLLNTAGALLGYAVVATMRRSYLAIRSTDRGEAGLPEPANERR